MGRRQRSNRREECKGRDREFSRAVCECAFKATGRRRVDSSIAYAFAPESAGLHETGSSDGFGEVAVNGEWKAGSEGSAGAAVQIGKQLSCSADSRGRDP